MTYNHCDRSSLQPFKSSRMWEGCVGPKRLNRSQKSNSSCSHALGVLHCADFSETPSCKRTLQNDIGRLCVCQQSCLSPVHCELVWPPPYTVSGGNESFICVLIAELYYDTVAVSVRSLLMLIVFAGKHNHLELSHFHHQFHFPFSTAIAFSSSNIASHSQHLN